MADADAGAPALTARAPAAAYDAKTGQLIVFGGGTAPTGGPSADTWTWTGTDWQQLITAMSPPGRMQAVMAYDDATGQLVLYGGNSGSSLLSDTWVWTGTNWKQHSPAHNPGAIFNAAMTYDPALHAMVLFGGQTHTGILPAPGPAPVWKWTGSDWVQLTTATGPADVVWPSMAYDPDHGQLLILAPFIDKPNGVSHQFLLLDAPTSTTLTAAQAAPVAPLTLTASVRARDVVTVSGSVSFTVDGQPVAGCATSPVVAGTATCQVTVAAGTHVARAVYTAGPGYIGSTSPKLTTYTT